MDHNRGLISQMSITPKERQEMDPIEIASVDDYGRNMLTVGQLRKIIANLDDRTLVVIDDGNAWWDHVPFVGVPGNDDAGYNALSLARGSALDTRDF